MPTLVAGADVLITGADTTTSYTATSDFNVVGGTDHALVVTAMLCEGASAVDSTLTVTAEGVAMTPAGRKAHSAGSSNPYVGIFYLVNPSPGATTIVASCNSINFRGCYLRVSEWSGVDAADPIGAVYTAEGVGDTLSRAMAPEAAGNKIITGMASRGSVTTYTPDTNVTETVDAPTGGGTSTSDVSCFAGYYTTVGTSSVNVGGDPSLNANVVIAAAELRAAAVGVTLEVPAAVIAIATAVPTLAAGKTIAAPVAAVAVAASAPTIAAGVALAVPVAAVVVAGASPTILGGVALAVPAAVVGIAPALPEVVAGIVIGVSVPVASLAVSALAPAILAGVSVAVPAANINAAPGVPSIAAGVALEVPQAAIDVAGLAPEISCGAAVEVAAAEVSIAALAPEIEISIAGVSINPDAVVIAIAALAPVRIGRVGVGRLGVAANLNATLPPGASIDGRYRPSFSIEGTIPRSGRI